MLKYLTLILGLFFLIACNREVSDETSEIEYAFNQVPDSTKPWTYWYWMNDFVSKEGISKDLESMAKLGISKAFIGNVGDRVNMGSGDLPMLSDEWWELMRWAIKEGNRTGVEIGIFNCPGWSQSGGPWITPEKSMRYIVHSEIKTKGARRLKTKLPKPAESFQDVVVLAFPAPSVINSISNNKKQIKSNPKLKNTEFISDGDLTTSLMFPTDSGNKKNYSFEFWLNKEIEAKSIIIYPAKKEILANCTLYAEINNDFVEVKQFELDRHNSSLNVGAMPFAPVAVALSGIKSSKFRLDISFKKDGANTMFVGGIREVEISDCQVLDSYIEKQLAKLHQTPIYSGNEYLWQTQAEIPGDNTAVDIDKIINISDKINNEGILEWDVPDGEWIIQRIGMTPVNVTNHPALPHATGLEVDRLDTSAVRFHFNSYIGKILEGLTPAEKKAFKYVIVDSYETGSQNWTDGFVSEFIKAYGYNPIPWLPVYSGKVVETAEKSDRFLWDVRRLISDLIAKKYIFELRKSANEVGAKLWLENYGHWGFAGESLIYGGYSDYVAGEFWNEGPLGDWECKIASSTAHIYGKNIVSAESFTTAGLAFRRAPLSFKKRGDWSYTQGINQVVLTLFIHQPFENKKPGVNAWFGSEINRHNTWFDKAKPWIDYQRRSNYLLQKGNYVADVCYFFGEDAPKSNGVQKPSLPQGYSFDFINYDVIMNRLDVKAGRFVLPGGMSYKIMVLPNRKTMRPELIAKISSLVEKGGVILGSPPLKSPSLKNYPKCDAEVQHISEKLWGNIEGKEMNHRVFGQGQVFQNVSLEQVFETLDLHPDFVTNAKVPVLWTHRSAKDMEIYFITNQSNKKVLFDGLFRAKDMEPEWWSAIDGSVRALPKFKETHTGVSIPISLSPLQSGFVVFKKKAKKKTFNENFPEFKVVAKITNRWNVLFSDPFGEKFSVEFTELTDWSKSEDERIKYFSGSAIYKNTFTVGEVLVKQDLWLNLGNVMVIAKVKLNGKEVGGVWTNPWRLKVTDFIQKGENLLEIEVANNWVNRLTGDAILEKSERKTWLSLNQFKADGQLQTSGLLGPVVLETIVSCEN
jgi:hypothetical protein